MTTSIVAAQSINWSRIWSDTLADVISFIPKLAIFLVILIIGWIIAKAVAKFLGVILHKVGFGQVLSKAGADEFLARAQINPIELICKLAYYFILLIVLQLALGAFGPSNPVSVIVNDIVAFLPRVFVAIIILIVVVAIANAVRDIMGAALSGLSFGALLSKIVGGFIIALGVIAALNQMGIGLTVTLPVLIAVLATVGGILVVGVGGGLISPMRSRWEGWLGDLESEARKAKETPPAPPQA